MNNIVYWRAIGYIYRRDKDGNPIKGYIKEKRIGQGIATEGNDFDGVVFRQSPNLINCDAVRIISTALA